MASSSPPISPATLCRTIRSKNLIPRELAFVLRPHPPTPRHFDTIAVMREAIPRPKHWKASDCLCHSVGNAIHIVPCCERQYAPKGKNENLGKRRWPIFRLERMGGRANVP